MVGALVPSGTIAGHAVGYLLAGESATLSGAHSQLRPVAWGTAALTVATFAGLALVRSRGHRRGGPLPSMACAQVVLFCALEAAEHVRAGHGAASLVGDPSFRWGVAAQLVTAGVLLAAARLARASGDCVRALLLRSRGPRHAARRRPPCRLRTVVPRLAVTTSVRERGPPGAPAPA